MKNLFLSITCCILCFSSVFSQADDKKSTLFSDIKALRLQYKLDGYNLNSTEIFGEGSKNNDARAALSLTKAKIDSLDKEYAKLLSKSELNEYTEWKRNEDIKDKTQDLGWWYATFFRKGC